MNRPLRFPRNEDVVNIGHVSDFYELLRMIDEVMPDDATLYLEGASIAAHVAAFLDARQATERPAVERGTIFPNARVFHLPLADRNLTQLRAIADRHAEPEVADHLVVHRDEQVLLWAHDAGSGDVLLSRALPEETIQAFRMALVR